MADNVVVTAGTGTTVGADEVVDATLGTVKVQYVKLMDGTLDGTTKAAVGASGLAADVKAVVPGTGATNLGKAEDAAHTTGDTGVMALAVLGSSAPSALAGTTGDYVPLITDASGRVHTKAVMSKSDGTVVDPVAAVAHDAVDSGEPNKVGGRAIAGLSTATLVSAADRTDFLAGLDGAQIIRPHCGLEDIVSGRATDTAAASTAGIAAQGVGVKTYLTSIILTNSSATNITVNILDGASVKLTLPVPANSGCVFNPPVPLGGTANTAWNFQGSAAATTLTCSMIGFKSKV